MSNDPVFRITDGPDRRATTNFITNPSIEVDLTDVLEISSGITWRTSDDSVFGGYSVLCTDNGNLNGGMGYLVTVSSHTIGDTYTASVFIKAANHSSVGKVIRLYNRISYTVAGDEDVVLDTTLTDEFVRYEVSNTTRTDESPISFYIFARNTSGDNAFWLNDGFQYERSEYATDYCDGSQPGCRWTGTPHASTSTREARTGTTIDLLAGNKEGYRGSYFLNAIRPKVTGFKSGGTWRDSPFADGRRLVDTKFTNVIEEIELKARNFDQDALIEQQAKLRRLLLKATQYWTTSWQNEPVWIEMRASCESETRYAIIHDARMPDDDNPFSQPFLQQGKSSVMDDLSLIVERGQWQDVPPGETAALPVSVVETYNDRSYGNYSGDDYALTFDGSGDYVTYGSDATIDDLPQSAAGFAAEAWVKPTATGAGPYYIFVKGTTPSLPATGWVFERTGTEIRWEHKAATTNPEALSSGAGLAIGQWSHVAVTYDDGGARTPRLWVNGVETSYATQNAAVGALTSDAASNLSASLTVNSHNGDMAWIRISNTERWTSSFSPSDKCSPPNIDANTVVQSNLNEGSGISAPNAAVGNANEDGTVFGATWTLLCEGERVTTTRREVFVANKRNEANITHIFIDDGGTFSENLLNSAPCALFPSTAAVDDAIYFGIDTSITDSGPFSSLVFDIDRPASATTSYSIKYEYWNGAWIDMDLSPAFVTDYTSTTPPGGGDRFSIGGVNVVQWNMPLDWAQYTVNMIQGYWVRARLSALTGTFTTPTQAVGNGIYTVTWPYAEVQESDINGDLPSIFDITQSGRYIFNSISIPSLPGAVKTGQTIAVRSLVRGEDFTPFLQASDEQNATGVTVSVVNGAFANSTYASPSFRDITSTITGNICRWSIDSSVAWQYTGTYDVYVRATTTGNDATVKLAASLDSIELFEFTSTKSVLLPATTFLTSVEDGYQMVSLGRLTIPDASNAGALTLTLSYSFSGAVSTIYVCDVILMPADEWIGVIRNSGNNAFVNVITDDTEAVIDATSSPKAGIKSTLLEQGTGLQKSPLYTSTAHPPSLKNEQSGGVRVWSFIHYEKVPSGGDGLQRVEWVTETHMNSLSRYTSGRGSK